MSEVTVRIEITERNVGIDKVTELERTYTPEYLPTDSSSPEPGESDRHPALGYVIHRLGVAAVQVHELDQIHPSPNLGF